VTWNYALAAFGTLLTVLTLLRLPRMVPERHAVEHPLRMLAQAFSFVFGQRLILALFAAGTLMTLTSSIRILFPALATGPYGGGAFETGLMYSAVPAGATAGAILSGWARTLEKPEAVMIGLGMLAFACVALLGSVGSVWFALPALAVYGYATAVASLLQYTMIQARTPDNYLGRVNSLWSAQDTLGDIVGALALGGLAQMLTPAQSVTILGVAAMALSLLLALAFRAGANRMRTAT
jgi:ENTS family enterobactin (siderophore) exporter